MNQFPKDLAEKILNEVARGRPDYPNLGVLTQLFETMYFASLRTEEAQQLLFHIVYMDPMNPDPNPPQRIVKDRWSYVPLGERISFTVPNLVKSAKAIDPRTSSFAVYHNAEGELFIWGLIDQGNRYHEFVNYDVDEGAERPGLFQASIAGLGHIIVSIAYERVAELRVNAIPDRSLDVLRTGPICNKLTGSINTYIARVRNQLPNDDMYTYRGHWDVSLTDYWIESLCRLLLRVQNYRHGGAILITPDDSHQWLNIKYSISYPRLGSALDTYAIATIQQTYASDNIFEFLDQDADEIPMDLYLDEAVNGSEQKESSR